MASAASARVTYDSPYAFERTWNAALRLVRVDNGLKVTEKDEAGGYLLFEYKSAEGSKKPTAGSLELVRPSGDGPVTVVVQLSAMPLYHEQVLLNQLIAKMRREYGEPVQKQPAAEPTDGAKDAGTQDGNGATP